MGAPGHRCTHPDLGFSITMVGPPPWDPTTTSSLHAQQTPLKGVLRGDLGMRRCHPTGRGNASKQAHNSARKKTYSQERPRFAAALFGPVFGAETTGDQLANGAGASREPCGVMHRGSEGRGAVQGFGSSLGVTYHVGCKG